LDQDIIPARNVEQKQKGMFPLLTWNITDKIRMWSGKVTQSLYRPLGLQDFGAHRSSTKSAQGEDKFVSPKQWPLLPPQEIPLVLISDKA